MSDIEQNTTHKTSEPHTATVEKQEIESTEAGQSVEDSGTEIHRGGSRGDHYRGGSRGNHRGGRGSYRGGRGSHRGGRGGYKPRYVPAPKPVRADNGEHAIKEKVGEEQETTGAESVGVEHKAGVRTSDTLYIQNISFSTTKEELSELFETDADNIVMPLRRMMDLKTKKVFYTKRANRGMAFIKYPGIDEAGLKAKLEKYNGYVFKDRPLFADIAVEKPVSEYSLRQQQLEEQTEEDQTKEGEVREDLAKEDLAKEDVSSNETTTQEEQK